MTFDREIAVAVHLVLNAGDQPLQRAQVPMAVSLARSIGETGVYPEGWPYEWPTGLVRKVDVALRELREQGAELAQKRAADEPNWKHPDAR